ncbi:endonuclease III domain-containing protein [Devriesea agamarum]|uniref:endonuclease III domain-containing protein n=1 Tax=Devriesea agamarum TaxID=472569 RepID=UPI000A0614CD|nr:endonuclease III [Devriesea agamarum]
MTQIRNNAECPVARPAPRQTIPSLHDVDDRLATAYPDAQCALHHRNAFELLVATVLSAQTTDARVNTVTPELFSRWPDAAALASAEVADVEAVIAPLGMAHTKSARLVRLGHDVLTQHGGSVPDDQVALEALPGVGRKTAHVVRGNVFGASLLTVDTHVGRLSRRLGWSSHDNPRQVEDDVVARPGASHINFTMLSHRLIAHGRACCTARAPHCGACVLADLCPRIGVVSTNRVAGRTTP